MSSRPKCEALTKSIFARLNGRRLPTLVRHEGLHDLEGAISRYDDLGHQAFDVETKSFRSRSRLGSVEGAEEEKDREEEHGPAANKGGSL